MLKTVGSVVSITPRARKQLVNVLKKRDRKTAIFYVDGGGCGGLRYKLEPLDKPLQKGDEIIPLDHGKELAVCGKSLLHLLGTKIDFNQDDFMGASFRFENPNIEATCGCGATFTPKKFEI